jgi:hypothetical protein
VGTRIRKRTFKNGDGPEGVDAYLSHVPPPVRALLGKLRKTIKSAAPMAQEVISYSMPSYRFQRPAGLLRGPREPLRLLRGKRERARGV